MASGEGSLRAAAEMHDVRRRLFGPVGRRNVIFRFCRRNEESAGAAKTLFAAARFKSLQWLAVLRSPAKPISDIRPCRSLLSLVTPTNHPPKFRPTLPSEPSSNPSTTIARDRDRHLVLIQAQLTSRPSSFATLPGRRSRTCRSWHCLTALLGSIGNKRAARLQRSDSA